MSESPLQTEVTALLEENFKLKFLKQGDLTEEEQGRFEFAKMHLPSERLVALRKEVWDKVRSAAIALRTES